MYKKYMNYILFFLLPIIWGGSFTAIKIAVIAQPPIFSALIRVTISLITLFILFYIFKKPTNTSTKGSWLIWIAGLFALGIPFALLFWAEKKISPSLAGILNGTVPIWTFILSIFVLQQYHMPELKRKILGLLIGISGILIIFLPALHMNDKNFNLLAALAVLGMAISYAIAALLSQYLLQKKGVGFFTNIYHQHWASLLFLLILSITIEHWPTFNYLMNNPQILLANAYLGIASTALGWIMYYFLINTWGAVRASLTAYLIPIAAIGWDWVMFQNQPKTHEIIGVIVIILGVVLVQSNVKKIKI